MPRRIEGVGTQYSWVPVGMVYQLVPHGEAPSAAAAVPFLPDINKQRYVRHPFDIEGYKVRAGEATRILLREEGRVGLMVGVGGLNPIHTRTHARTHTHTLSLSLSLSLS